MKTRHLSIYVSLVTTLLITFALIIYYSYNRYVNISFNGMFVYVSIFSIATLAILYKDDVRFHTLFKNTLTLRNITSVILLVILISCFTFTFDGSWNGYVTDYPVIAAGKDFFFNKDTSFNISLIRSILNFGYPSVALDGHQLTAYHVLSHYIDAIFLKLSSLDPFDSYGFATFIKRIFVLFWLMIYLSTFAKNVTQVVVSFILLAPLYAATWHIIGSYALWSDSFIILLSISHLIKLEGKESTLNNIDYSLIFISIIALCIGKVSTGFMFTCTAFSFILIREYKKPKLYIFALLSLFFLIAYQKFINLSYGVSDGLSPSNINIHSLSIFVFNDAAYQKSASLIPVVTLVVYLFFKQRNALSLFISSCMSYIALFCTISAFSGFNDSDKTYFVLGYHSIYVLMASAVMLKNINNTCDTYTRNKAIVFCISISYLFSVFSSTTFISINNFTPVGIKRLLKNADTLHENNYSRITYTEELKNNYIHVIRSEIDEILKTNKTTPSKAAIYIPPTIVEKEIRPLIKYNQDNFYGMALYSMSGIQLIQSVIGKQRAYGFANYEISEPNYIYSIINDTKSVCRKYNINTIIVIESITSPRLKNIYCN